MDALVVAGLVVLIAQGALLILLSLVEFHRRALYFWILVFLMIGNLAFVIYRYERNRSKTEAVWHEKAITWSKMPLSVYWDPTHFTAYSETFHVAMNTWNQRAGCTLFISGLERDAHVRIRSADGTKCGAETLQPVEVEEDKDTPAHLFYCNGYTDIQLKRLDTTTLAFRVMLHELGHTLGLEHDRDGAMAETVVDPSRRDPPEFLLPNQRDIEAIRARYCR